MRLLPRARPRPDPAQGMSVIEHLDELRTRLIICLLAIAVGTVVGWVFYAPIFTFITQPYTSVCRGFSKSVQSPTNCKLVFQGVVEPFLIRFKVSLAAGVAIALPV